MLIRPGSRILAAVSGGADSMALLHVLHAWQEVVPFHLTVVHVHHGLRGRAADRDAVFVARWAAKLGVPCRVARVDVRRRMGCGVSLEMAARSARHEVLRKAMRADRADAVALAHHRDDQVETVLMRLLAGTGMDGLGGMDYRAEPMAGLSIIRPLLDVSRDDIEHYLNARHLAWREDRSNRDRAMMRNRIRHEVIPAIEAAGYGSVAESVCRLADMMREEQIVLDERTKRLRVPVTVDHTLLRLKYKRLAVADQRRVLRSWLSGKGRSGRGLDFDSIEHIRKLLVDTSSGRITLDRMHEVAWSVERIRIELRKKTPARKLIARRLKLPGTTVLTGAGLVAEVCTAKGFRRLSSSPGVYPATVFIRREAGVRPALAIRSRKPGDAMQPTGMGGSVSLKEWLINAKVPLAMRDRLPVLVCGDDVIWMAGYRVDQRWSVPSASSPSWRITIRPAD